MAADAGAGPTVEAATRLAAPLNPAERNLRLEAVEVGYFSSPFMLHSVSTTTLIAIF